MDALGALNPLEVVEAEIQKKIGRFLGLKSTLLALRDRHGSLTIREEAAGLLAMQSRLGNKLTETLAKIDNLKAGAWSFGNVIEVSSFSVDLVTQINKVEKLKEKANMMTQGTTQTQAGTFGLPFEMPFDVSAVPTWMWVAGGFMLWKIIR